MRTIKRLAAALMAATFLVNATPALAELPSPQVVGLSLLHAADITGYPVPRVEAGVTGKGTVVSVPILPRVVEDATFLDEIGAAAAYNHITNTLTLDEDFNPRNLSDAAVLTHELIHYLQDAQGLLGEDPGCLERWEAEKQAYDGMFDYISRVTGITEKGELMELANVSPLVYILVTNPTGQM